MLNDGAYVKKKITTNYKNNAIFFSQFVQFFFQFRVFLIKNHVSF